MAAIQLSPVNGIQCHFSGVSIGHSQSACGSTVDYLGRDSPAFNGQEMFNKLSSSKPLCMNRAKALPGDINMSAAVANSMSCFFVPTTTQTVTTCTYSTARPVATTTCLASSHHVSVPVNQLSGHQTVRGSSISQPCFSSLLTGNGDQSVNLPANSVNAVKSQCNQGFSRHVGTQAHLDDIVKGPSSFQSRGPPTPWDLPNHKISHEPDTRASVVNHDAVREAPELLTEGVQRKQKKTIPYDGKTSFHDYLVQFELIAQMNGWSCETRAFELAACLRGKALSVLGNLDAEQRTSYQSLTQALKSRFEPGTQSEMYRCLVKNRVRSESESLPELVHDIKRLVRLAYPSALKEVKEAIAKDCFVDALGDAGMELYVFQAKSSNIDEALQCALEYEAFNKGRAYRDTKVKPLRVRALRGDSQVTQCDGSTKTPLAEWSVNETKNLTSTKKFDKCTTSRCCYYCGRKGHFIAKCFRRKKAERKFRLESRRYSSSVIETTSSLGKLASK